MKKSSERILEIVFQLFIKDFEGSCIDEKNQIYQWGSREGFINELMDDDIFLGYVRGLIGKLTPDDFLKELRQRRPQLYLSKSDDISAVKYPILGQKETPGLEENLFEIRRNNYEYGWDKVLNRRSTYQSTQ